MRTRTAKTLLLAWLALAPAAAGAAESADDYATSLAIVYEGYQHMLAMKEACDKAAPAARAANDRAFTAWTERHRVLIQDLRRRVTAMIRSASTDDKDYARNLGKYEGAMLQERQTHRDSLLNIPADDLREQCKRMPESLKDEGADLAKVYSAELAVIRKRK